LLESTLPKMVTIETHLAGSACLVNADMSQLEQVIINLAANAADAMPEGGKLVIETQLAELDEEYSRRYLEINPGRYVLLVVSDTGQGMDAATREHMFEPFFTTKEVGKGTGLGLATVHGVIRAHGGQIHCYSEPGLGTTFKCYLPAHQGEPPETVPSPGLDSRHLRGSETVLLVDDEEALRDIGSSTLSSMGYQVLTAASGEEALETYRSRAGGIDLVILDLGMPGMGGKRCLAGLLALDGRAKVIIASGYSANGPVKEALEAGASGYLAKPYRLADLLTAIRDVLGG
jgi:CheY-like chemotaxis protein